MKSLTECYLGVRIPISVSIAGLKRAILNFVRNLPASLVKFEISIKMYTSSTTDMSWLFDGTDWDTLDDLIVGASIQTFAIIFNYEPLLVYDVPIDETQVQHISQQMADSLPRCKGTSSLNKLVLNSELICHRKGRHLVLRSDAPQKQRRRSAQSLDDGGSITRLEVDDIPFPIYNHCP